MWTGYKILIFFSLTTDICTETHFSQGEAEPGPRFTRNHTIFEGSRHKRAIFQGNTVGALAVVKLEMTPVSLSSMRPMHCVTVTASVSGTPLIAVLITSHSATKKKKSLLSNSLQTQKVASEIASIMKKDQ